MTLASAFFSGSETALIGSRKITLKDLAEKAIEIAKKCGAQQAGARASRSREVSLEWRNGSDDQVLHLDDVRLVGNGTARLLGDFETEATGWTGLHRSEAQAHSGKAAGKWWFPSIAARATCRRFPVDWSGVEKLEFWVHAAAPTTGELIVLAESRLPDTTRADAILTHKFAIGGFKPVYDFGPRLDWSANAMKEGESSTIEWNAQLNRHFHFKILVDAYWTTGDEKYARELAQELNAWIEDNPVLLFQSGK